VCDVDGNDGEYSCDAVNDGLLRVDDCQILNCCMRSWTDGFVDREQ
jgi:hypothetical protein